MIPEWLITPPASTILVLLVSVLMTFASSSINRLFSGREHRQRLAALRSELDKLNREKRENQKKAKSTGDAKLLKKVKKQERQILQLQSQMASLSLKQMRSFPITMVMFLFVWMLLTGNILFFNVFESPLVDQIIAYLPWIGEELLELNLFYWYLLCSFLFGTLFSRIFGLTGVE